MAAAYADESSADFKRFLLEVRQAVHEEHLRLKEELASYHQQLLQQQSALVSRLVSRSVSVRTPEGLDDVAAEGALRSAYRSCGRLHGRVGAEVAHDVSFSGTESPDFGSTMTPRRRARLQLPVRPRRPASSTSDTPTTSGHPAAPSDTSVAAEYTRPLDSPESPKREAPPLMRDDTMEIQSHHRNEEDERWREQWKTQAKSRLSERLAVLKKNRGASSVSIQDMLRTEPKGCRHCRGHDSSSRSCLRRQEPANKLETFVDGNFFQIACSLLIFSNAIFIGVSVEHNVKHVDQEDPAWSALGNQMFVGLFIFEILLRMAAKRWRFFLGDDWKWNLFDVVLAVYSVVEELVHGFAVTYARLLRSFRMVRVLRVLRVMRFFRELRLMVCSITRSLGSLAWAGLLLLMIMYMFTICFMHAAINHLHEPGTKRHALLQLQESYGSIWTTMFSLLMAISGGVDWIDLVRPLAEIHWIYQALFAFYVLFVLIGVLNVLTSVFVERANELSRLDRDLVIQSEMVSNEAFLNEMQAIFEEVDINCTGKITWQDFHDYLQNEDVQAYFATQQLDTSDARGFFNLLDVDQNEEVKVEEFVMGCMRLRGQAKSSDVATLLKENRKTSQKNMRVMRKLEIMLRSIQGNVRDMRSGSTGSSALGLSNLPSPTSLTSRSPSRRLAGAGTLALNQPYLHI